MAKDSEDFMERIYEATLNDLPFLIELEKSFKKERMFNKQQLARSITSNHQSVYIISVDNNKAGSITLFNFKTSVRIYSIAILNEYRKLGLGKVLMTKVIEQAKKEGKSKVTLEVDINDTKLINWYESFGFMAKSVLPNYYGNGEAALKMELILEETSKKIKNLLVYNNYFDWLDKIKNVEIISAEEFINTNRYKRPEYRVFNFCESYDYQKIGYFVSLFSQARDQRSIPNIVTIEDVLDETILSSISEEIEEIVYKTFKNEVENEIIIDILWGKTNNEKFKVLAKHLYNFFASPILRFKFIKEKVWLLKEVKLNFSDFIVDDKFINDANEYLSQKKFYDAHFKNYKYDLAILVDDEDESRPSDKVALAKFKHAAEKKGFYTEFITKDDYYRLNQFDALFIRTTTNVNNYTYQFSRLAYAEGLVVIDDPWSILKCANKLYLHESMEIHQILTPETIFVTNNTNLDEVINNLNFPIVLKQPDSAASKGVFKATNKEELTEKINELFKVSEIIIAQEYLKTDFDWRVGILDGKAIYVCKYYMAKNHWQIYNWSKNNNPNKKFTVGGVETFLVDEVPKKVIKQAVKAASIMGDGFYGVDLKEVNGEVYLIEVNDNPSIDSGWEDKKLKDELYNIIINYFYEKIEESRNHKKRMTHLKNK